MTQTAFVSFTEEGINRKKNLQIRRKEVKLHYIPPKINVNKRDSLPAITSSYKYVTI